MDERASENLLKLLDECWSRDWPVAITGPLKGHLSRSDSTVVDWFQASVGPLGGHGAGGHSFKIGYGLTKDKALEDAVRALLPRNPVQSDAGE